MAIFDDRKSLHTDRGTGRGATGDLDGDGKDDVLWRRKTGELLAWYLNGTSSSPKGTRYYGRIDSAWKILASAEFDNDGNADILWRRDSGEVLIWLLNNGTRGIRATASPGVADPATWDYAGSGGFNGEGQLDFVWRNNVSGRLLIWHVRIGLIDSTSELGGAASNWTLIAVADLTATSFPICSGATARATFCSGSWMAPRFAKRWAAPESISDGMYRRSAISTATALPTFWGAVATARCSRG